MCWRSAPSRSIAATVASTMPASAPRQPACAAPTTRGLRVGKEHRPAIGRGNADGERAACASRCRRRAAAHPASTASRRPRRAANGSGRRSGNDPARRRAPPPCGRGSRRLGGAVLRADAAVEAGIDPGGDAAMPRKEAMAEAGQREGSRPCSIMRHASKPGSSPSFGSAMASALNNSPIPRLPPAIRRDERDVDLDCLLARRRAS